MTGREYLKPKNYEEMGSLGWRIKSLNMWKLAEANFDSFLSSSNFSGN